VAKPSSRTRSSSRASAAQAPGGQVGGAVGDEDLADRRRVEVDGAPDPLPGAEEVAALDLGEVLDAVDARHGEVDRLATGLGQDVQRRLGQLDDVAVHGAAVGEAQDRRAGLDLAAGAGAAHEAVALQAGDEPRRRALGQVGGLGEVADADRILAVEHERQQLGRAVDRLGALDGLSPSHALELLFHAR
jgi:hypothetical protein